MKTRLVFLVFLCFASTFVFADEGHHHGDITEAQVGTVHFPSSCAPSIQPRVQRGVAMLHSFWYEEAQKNFEEIEKDDPTCAIAHWGVAMSLWHQLWNRPDWEVLQHGGIELQKAKSYTRPRENAGTLPH